METETYLRNLLAVIHRDGGHYTEEHGLKKSSEDAEKIFLRLLRFAEGIYEEI